MYTYILFKSNYLPKGKLILVSRAFKQINLHSPPIMYSSSFITQTFLFLLLFLLQDTTKAKDDSGLMRLRAQKRNLADLPLFENFFSSNNHLRPEQSSKMELTTASSGSDVLEDEIDQQLWFHPEPAEKLLTACPTITDESDLPILPGTKFQRRQNACPPVWKPQPSQPKLKLDGQGQRNENGQTIPDGTGKTLGREAQPGELSKWNTYPNALELFRLYTFGQMGNPNWICDGFVGQSIPMCAPFSLSILVSPADVLAPSRFCMCVYFFVMIPLFSFGMFPPGRKRLIWKKIFTLVSRRK